MSQRLEGRRILVTAASGITGEAIALLCGQEGGRLALASRDVSSLVETVGRIQGIAEEALPLQGEPVTEEGARRLVAEAAEALGGLDGVVYNVGGFVAGNLRTAETPTEELERMLRQHTTGAFFLLRAALPHLAQSGRGSAVLIGASDRTRQRGNVAYAVAKGAMVPLIRKVAREYYEDSIRVNLVQPNAIEEVTSSWPVVPTQGPMTGAPGPTDIAYACVYLLSDESRTLTGQVLTIDGGQGL